MVKCGYADKYQGKREPTCGCEVCGLKWQIAQLQAELGTLRQVAGKLRHAQREYMADRGNDKKGRLVAMAASYLDAVLLTEGEGNG